MNLFWCLLLLDPPFDRAFFSFLIIFLKLFFPLSAFNLILLICSFLIFLSGIFFPFLLFKLFFFFLDFVKHSLMLSDNPLISLYLVLTSALIVLSELIQPLLDRRQALRYSQILSTLSEVRLLQLFAQYAKSLKSLVLI